MIMSDNEKTIMRLERLENHYDFLKDSTKRIESKVGSISDALLGNEFGSEGLVNAYKLNQKRLIENEKEIERMKIYHKQLSWLFAIIGSTVVVILVKFIFKAI